MKITKSKMYETCIGCSMYVPSDPAVNAALQNTQVQGFSHDNVTLEQMREVPELYSKQYGKLDKLCAVQQAERNNVPELKKTVNSLKDPNTQRLISAQLGKKVKI